MTIAKYIPICQQALKRLKSLIHPSPEKKTGLEARFDARFTTQTSFETLNQTLRQIQHNKAELLLVLDRPDIALHTNGSERDLRDPVKKRKVSGGT